MTKAPARSVFVAEKDRRLLELIELALSDRGYSVVCVQDAAQTLEDLQQATPHLIVLGKLPDMSAQALAARLRRVPRLKTVPILLSDGSTVAQPDADSVIARPFTGQALAAAVDTLLGERGAVVSKSPHTVMVIEDSAALRGLIGDILHRQGFSVEIAENFSQAKALIRLRAKEVSLVLLDVNLPGGTGFELLELIRQRSDVPVFILSALKQQEQMKRGEALGAQAFIEKPFNPRELVKKIRETLI